MNLKSTKQPTRLLDLASFSHWAWTRAPTILDATVASEWTWRNVCVLSWVCSDSVQTTSFPHTKAFFCSCLLSKFLQLENVEHYPREIHTRQKENTETSFLIKLALAPLFWNLPPLHTSEWTSLCTRQCSRESRHFCSGGLLMSS